MNLWNDFVGLVESLLAALAGSYGGSLGLAIITLSLLIRLALLPLTLRAQRQSHERQARLQRLQPEIAQLRGRYQHEPERQARALAELYRREGLGSPGWGTVVGLLVQLPLVAALYTAIQHVAHAGGAFLWIRSLAQPDLLLTGLVVVLAGLAGALGPGGPQQPRALLVLFPAIVTAFIAWKLAAGVGLYWAASSGVGLLQAVLLRTQSRDGGQFAV